MLILENCVVYMQAADGCDKRSDCVNEWTFNVEGKRKREGMPTMRMARHLPAPGRRGLKRFSKLFQEHLSQLPTRQRARRS